MLKIENLNARIKEKEILKNFNIDIKDGEIHAIMGPNGTGKSTLSKVIMGNKNYEVTSGNIVFNGQVINNLKTDERARLGIFLSMQNPISIEGVSNTEFLKTALNEVKGEKVSLYEFIKTVSEKAKELDIKDEMLHRSINSGASGGERKKNEVLQINVLEPKFIILDELDSGLDIDSLKIVSKSINKYLEKNKNTSVLIITHYPRILEYIKPNYVHVMMNGKIVKTGNMNLAKEIEKNGYNDTFDMGKSKIYE